MAKGVYRKRDGAVMVDYSGRHLCISRAQYNANGYRPLYDRLVPEPPLDAEADSPRKTYKRRRDRAEAVANGLDTEAARTNPFHHPSA